MFRREAVDLFVALLRMFIERLLQRGVGEFDSADVGDVFALCEFAVDVQARQRLVFVVLLHDRTRALFEFLRGLRRPPVAQVAFGVELPSLIIEAVRHFMADYGANPAVVHCVVGIGIEEGRLQNAGRKHNLVHVRVVVGVDRRRCHSPVGAIDRLADLVNVAIGFEFFGPQRVQHKWPAIDLQQ